MEYQKPKMEFVNFEKLDVITASIDTGDNGGTGGPWEE